MKRILLISLCLSIAFAAYSVGQTVSIPDQEVILEGCATNSEYFGQEFSLAGWNGDLNGGEYKVIWLEMSASW